MDIIDIIKSPLRQKLKESYKKFKEKNVKKASSFKLSMSYILNQKQFSELEMKTISHFVIYNREHSLPNISRGYSSIDFQCSKQNIILRNILLSSLCFPVFSKFLFPPWLRGKKQIFKAPYSLHTHYNSILCMCLFAGLVPGLKLNIFIGTCVHFCQITIQ